MAQSDPRTFAATFDGLPIEGARPRVALDRRGRPFAIASGARNLVARPLGEFELDASTLRRRFALSGSRVGAARPAWWPTEAGLAPCWVLTRERGARSFEELVVDARDGRLLAQRERVRFGEGVYPWFGERVAFPTGSAKAAVYANVGDALAEHASVRKLKAWSLGVPAPVGLPRGFLVGARVDVYDALGDWAVNYAGKFVYGLDTFPQFFDQANAYWQVDAFHRHLRKALGRELATDFALPVIVNEADTLPGGYYTPATLPDGHAAGYVVLFDLEEFLGAGADSARDPALVAHEYVHAWLDREGRAFDGAVGDPTRALEEALADFFALAKQKDTAVGRVLAEFAGPSWLRDLDDEDHLLESLTEAQAAATQGLFDEHRASEVFGSLLLDARRELGVKHTERWVDRAIELMPHSLGELGLGLVGPTEAIDAASVCFASASLALLTAADGFDDIATLIGAATGRGVFGDPASAIDVELQLEAFPKRATTLPSTFARGDEVHSYFFRANPGRELTLTLRADGSDVLPDFELVGPLGAQGPKTYTQGGRRVRQTGIELVGPLGTTYEVRVRSTDGARGRYRLRLDA
ncbi:MAG: hypothetical protein IT453_01740 [Planctomycetes bacterium]|nr:hypothetical protein [Planctomycetota bacterium]